MNYKQHISGLGAFCLALVLFMSGCDDSSDKHYLGVVAYPEEAALVGGEGVYEAETLIRISASLELQKYELVNWVNSGGDKVGEELSFDFIMPAHPDTITANFFVDYGVTGAGVSDIDNNLYQTVIIGDQEWMAENLRTSRYRDGSAINTALSNADWMETNEGAYSVFDHNHQDAAGITSAAAMIAAYGKLYNWFAVNDSRGLCPPGWRVPGYSDWQKLITFIEETHGIMNENETGGLGNALKAAFQFGHPWGAEFMSNEHPRWNEHRVHYGKNNFGFSALPAGYRDYNGVFYLLGYPAFFWSSTEETIDYAWYFYINTNMGNVNENNRFKELGLSVRCVRE